MGVYLDTGKAVGGAGNDSLSNIENIVGTNFARGDFLTGDASANEIYGFAGNDQIKGGAGTDRLIGGGGNDNLTGGADADTFVFAVSGFGNDTITDFQDNLDKINLSGTSGYTGADVGGNAVLTFTSGEILTVENITCADLTDDIFSF